MNLTIAAIAFGIAYCLTLAASYYWQRRYVELERRHIDTQARLGGALSGLERAEQREREWEDCHMCDGVGHYGGLDCPLCAGAGGWHYCAACYEIEMRAEQDEHDPA